MTNTEWVTHLNLLREIAKGASVWRCTTLTDDEFRVWKSIQKHIVDDGMGFMRLTKEGDRYLAQRS